jgi:hypothetical protein
MKKVLAELHELINELEDNGLTAEASSLQDVFIRVALEADVKDDLANDVENVLKSHSAAEVLAEIAKQMASESEPESDTQTMSFAYGDEPTEPNTGDNAEQPRKWKPAQWKPWPRETLIDQAVRYKVNEPHGNLGRRAFEDLNFRLDQARKVDPLSYDPITLAEFNKLVEERRMNPPQPDLTDPREQVLQDFREEMKEMNKYYDKNLPWSTGRRF